MIVPVELVVVEVGRTLLRRMVILDGADEPGVGVVEADDDGDGAVEKCGGDREVADESRRTGRDDIGTVGSRVRVGDSLRTGWMSFGFVRPRAASPAAAAAAPLVGGVTASLVRALPSASDARLAASGNEVSLF